jgi:hypothetical protein
LFAPHLLNAVIAVVDAKDFFATQELHADDEDVLADQHIPAMQLSGHGKLPPAHVRHEEYR